MKRTSRRTTTTIEAERPFAFALGANLGDAVTTLRTARDRLAARFGPLVASSLYRTEPVSPIRQSDFWNAAVRGVSDEPPETLLAFALELEVELGRRRRQRDAPREIDIDLLLVGRCERHSVDFELPHPRLRQRRFVLEPLAEIGGELTLPPDGISIAELLARLPDSPRVERLGSLDETAS